VEPDHREKIGHPEYFCATYAFVLVLMQELYGMNHFSKPSLLLLENRSDAAWMRMLISILYNLLMEDQKGMLKFENIVVY
jgi:hypothetical protein